MPSVVEEAAARIEAGADPSLAELAVHLGYADQAHLTRDFKAMVGKTPAGFRVAVHR
jgi:AraC-like DNA-binding protein